MKTIICHKDRIDTLMSQKLDWNKVKWVYFCEDYIRASELKDKMAQLGAKEICYNQELNDIFRKLKPSFIDLVGVLGKNQPKRQWIVSSIAEKNSASTIYLDICRAYYAANYLLNKESDSVLVFVCARKGLLRVLSRIFLKAQSLYPNEIKLFGGRIKSYFEIRFKFLLSILSKRLKLRKVIPPAAADIILRTWGDERSFNEKGEFNEIYFGELYDQMLSDNIDFVLLPYLLNKEVIPKFERMREKKKSKILYYESLINFTDIIILLIKGIFKKPLKFKNIKFSNFYIDPIFNEAALEDVIGDRYSFFYREEILVKKLSKLGWQPSRCIFSMENQSWERVFCYAVKRYMPGCQTVAYQHASLSPKYLFYCPSKLEIDYMPGPDVILTVGRVAKDYLGKYGYGAEIEIGGALRYNHLFKKDKTEVKKTDGKTVLILLSFENNLALELILKIIKWRAKNNDLSLIIKPHPCSKIPPTMMRQLESLSKTEIRNAPVSELLKACNLVLYMDTGVCIEALAMSKPVMHIVPAYVFDVDPLENYNDFKINIYDLKGLVDNQWFYPETAEDFIERYYSKPEPGLLRKFYERN